MCDVFFMLYFVQKNVGHTNHQFKTQKMVQIMLINDGRSEEEKTEK